MGNLRLDGEVERELELAFEDLAGFPGQVDDLTRLVPGREGGAVRFGSLLEAAQPRASATHATLSSGDGDFTASVPLEALAEAVVAYRDGDAALPASRGGPFRFFIPEGGACATAEVDQCANVKFLATIRFTAGRGQDSRPTNPTEHAELHEHDEN
ncbi:MAG: molybdopterin-dependent oxidoreductase [Candidatus Binatia bacterium]|nr:molybdopterin-dependent oxidoreductase [Candidatus Binatia bacterium]